MMHQRKSKKIFFYFFLLFLFGSINNISFQSSKLLNLNNIKVSGLDDENNKDVLKNLKSLKLNNIFFLREDKIKNIIEINPLIENYKISKIYPDTLDIQIHKTKFLGKINQDGRILFLGSNGKLSEYTLENRKLPFIFGKPKIQEFLDFKKIIDESKFSYFEIENFYFYPSKRWDIELNNNIVLKLPKDDTKNSLDYIFNFLKNNNIKNNKIIDARVNSQIILND